MMLEALMKSRMGVFIENMLPTFHLRMRKKLWLPALSLTGCCQNRSIANKSKERFVKNTGRTVFAPQEWRIVGK